MAQVGRHHRGFRIEPSSENGLEDSVLKRFHTVAVERRDLHEGFIRQVSADCGKVGMGVQVYLVDNDDSRLAPDIPINLQILWGEWGTLV